ncbi:MAG: M48 family metallopeptidase [Phycisphaeraceae bacterium]|nr:M48 family metallopeptidase [Phycisphaeraceae bacterium]
MDFFESQHKAHRKTGRLVVLFVLAVIAIILTVHVVLALIFSGVAASQGHAGQAPPNLLLDPRMFLGVTVVVSLIVMLASALKMGQLRGGGRVVAESLGGRLLDPGSVDPTERKILNVVEEMSIASGVPVPPVYLLDDERAINAFAAGFSPSDAVIGVTRGCVELLDRDQLQGVMAHEFSHILNGDMRLNIRLIGVIFGILVIGMIGQMILRSLRYSTPRRSNSKNGGGAILMILAVGLALMIIGALGVFFGNLIKAAISRQREFLADASAVQFTRYPDGIAGALKKIGGYTYHAQLVHPKADEASHMYFGEGVTSWLGGAMATHPPLAERIRRIDPGWDGKFPDVEPPQYVKQDQDQRRRRMAQMTQQRQAMAMAAPGIATGAAIPAAVVGAIPGAGLIGSIGNPTQEHVDYAAVLLDQLDDQLRAAVREPYGSRALIYALLLDRDDAVRRNQVETLQKQADPRVAALTLKLADVAANVDPAARLPLIDLAMPALRQLAEMQYRIFRGNVDALIEADQRINIFEWTLRRILLRHLDSHFEQTRRPVVQYYNLRGLRDECSLLLSLLAYVGHTDKEAGAAAFRAGASAMGLSDLSPLPPGQCSMAAFGQALDKLNQVAAPAKRPIIAGAVACIASDRQATIREVELLRAICDTLDCPVPPLLPGQALV